MLRQRDDVEFFFGLLWSPILATVFTVLQRASEDGLRGRVMSLCNMCTAAAMIVSMACGGALTDLLGVRPVIAGFSTLIVLAGVIGLILIRATPVSPIERTNAEGTLDRAEAVPARVS